MKSAWWTAFILALIGLGAASILWIGHVAADALGPLKWGLYGAGLLFMAGAVLLSWPRWSVRRETDLRELALLRMEAALQERAERIGRRQRELTRQLMRLHEWTEFPGGDPTRPETSSVLPVAEDLGEKDRAVMTLLEKRTEVLFEKIKTNAYQKEGVFQRERLAGDLMGLIESVARIYNPGSRQPLLETSVESLLRAANRISLQLLFLLEGLPLDVKTYNLQTTYETIRKGARAYGVYKSAVPYLSFASPLYYLSRYAVGAAPVTLGAGWALSELFKSGARRLSRSMANRYALGLLRDMVLIIGGEAAGVFGGDYRHRDPNWIFGAELTGLMAACPLSPEIHRHALEEVNRLVLRNEYDRLFLYRCLASGTSARPERFADPRSLPVDQREIIAGRLERFYRRRIRGAVDGCDDLMGWRREAEQRLGVKMRMATAEDSETPPPGGSADALFSLAGFLAEVKGCDIGQWPVVLSETRLFKSLDPDEKERFLKDITAAPPMIFDYPDLDPEDERVETFLADLSFLTARVHPRGDEIGEVVLEAARYFRKTDLKAVMQRLDRAYAEMMSSSLRRGSPEKRVHPEVARSLLYVLEEGEFPRFLYRSVSLRMAEGQGEPFPFPPYADPWLMGTDERVVLVAVNRKFKGAPILIWSGSRSGRGTGAATLSRVKGRFRDTCRLMGGTWHWDRAAPLSPAPAILLSGPAMGRYEGYFRPLTDFFKPSA